jgi:hypothetical protein
MFSGVRSDEHPAITTATARMASRNLMLLRRSKNRRGSNARCLSGLPRVTDICLPDRGTVKTLGDSALRRYPA